MKKAIDRIIGLASPFFTVIRGEVHHRARYDRYPALAALGINHGHCAGCPDVFHTLLYRNALNFHCPMAASATVESGEAGERLRARVGDLLDRLQASAGSELPIETIRKQDLMSHDRVDLTGEGPTEALLLVGSPKVQSTSASLAEALMLKLRERGWRTETMRILPALKKEERWRDLAQAVGEADLVVLSSPLYVDSLPAPVTRALERIAEVRGGAGGRKEQGFAAISNNGFPEAFQNHTALAIARRFAEEAGFVWLGGLALGMGGALDGRSLAKPGRMLRNAVTALDMTAAAFTGGDAVPEEAFDLMARPLMPRWLYLLGGNWGWRSQARKHGVGAQIADRPYQPTGT